MDMTWPRILAFVGFGALCFMGGLDTGLKKGKEIGEFMDNVAKPLDRYWIEEYERARRIVRELTLDQEFVVLHIDADDRPHFAAALKKRTLPKMIEILSIMAQVPQEERDGWQQPLGPKEEKP